MQTPPTNNMSRPTNEEEPGYEDSNKTTQLDPWIIAHLLICTRDEQPTSIEEATDDEFDTWVNTHGIRVKENGITGWSFDDRCRLVNYALAHGYTFTFIDGRRIPEPTQPEEEEMHPMAPQEEAPTVDTQTATEQER